MEMLNDVKLEYEVNEDTIHPSLCLADQSKVRYQAIMLFEPKILKFKIKSTILMQ